MTEPLPLFERFVLLLNKSSSCFVGNRLPLRPLHRLSEGAGDNPVAQ